MGSESEELINRLREIVESSDLNTTTAGAVRRQLESEFGIDLSQRKKFISQQIDEILETRQNNVDVDVAVAVEQQQQEEEDELEGETMLDDEQQQDQQNKSSDELELELELDDEPIKKKKGTGFTRLCSLSPQLQDFVGVPEMARTEVVKKLWAYIRENDLQVPSNRRNIKCDSKLHSLFRVDTINMFQMNKALSKHIWPLDPQQVCTANSPPAEKKQKRQREEVEKPQQKAKQQKGGFLAPLQMSEAFVKFLGTGETTLSRAEAVKRIWNYIKENNLQDPSDKRRILCDEKLKELFEVETFNGFSVTKYLSAHLSKVEQ